MQTTYRVVIVLALLYVAYACGNADGRAKLGNHMNDLLRVGFTMTDPEGYEVESFDVSGERHYTFTVKQ